MDKFKNTFRSIADVEPFTVELKTVVEAAARAYAEGRLNYQKGEDWSRYRGPLGGVCVVGAALSPEQLDTVEDYGFNSQDVWSLYTHGIVSYPSRFERQWVERLQRSYDNVLPYGPAREGEFLQALRDAAAVSGADVSALGLVRAI